MSQVTGQSVGQRRTGEANEYVPAMLLSGESHAEEACHLLEAKAHSSCVFKASASSVMAWVGLTPAGR